MTTFWAMFDKIQYHDYQYKPGYLNSRWIALGVLELMPSRRRAPVVDQYSGFLNLSGQPGLLRPKINLNHPGLEIEPNFLNVVSMAFMWDFLWSNDIVHAAVGSSHPFEDYNKILMYLSMFDELK